MVSNIAELSLEEKKKMMAALLLKKAAQPKAYPCSFAQKRLWFLDQMEPGQPFYNHSRRYSITGDLHPEYLEEAFVAVINRHPALRTSFAQDSEGAPTQLVHPTMPFKMPHVDLHDWATVPREEKFRELLNQQARTIFYLDKPPLYRATLISLNRQEHALVVTFHHILVDGWSMGIFQEDLEAYYFALVQGHVAQLPKLPITYADFSLWQNQKMEKGAYADQLKYWLGRLSGALPVYELPQDYKRPPTRSFEGANTYLTLSTELSFKLNNLARQEGVTLFMALMAAFKVLLHRYTSEEDLLIGSPIANRNRPEIERLIGFFVNTLAMRTSLSGNPGFTQLLSRVRETTLGAYANQDLPFEKIVEALHPDREVNHTPIVQVMFILQNSSTQVQAHDQSFIPQEVDSGTSKFDLIFQFREGADGLESTINYNTSLFRNDTVNRMLRHFRCLIQDIVEHPHERIQNLRLLTEEERIRIIYDWNNTSRRYPKNATIHEVFEERAYQNPEDDAVTFGNQSLRYGRLNQLANRVAHMMTTKGIRAGDKVALCMQPSVNLVASILGILKLGAAYVPLDPSHPEERLGFMLEDSGSKILLLDQSHQDHLSSVPVGRHMLNDDGSNLDRFSSANLPLQGFAESLAYLIYTSGSTGKPKGVSVPHRAVNRLVLNSDYVVFQPEFKVAQIANFSFDAVTFELWGALLNGSELVGIPKELILSPLPFARRIRETHVTCMFITTALFNHVISVVPDAFITMKYLLVGGEAIEPHWMEVALKSGPPLNLLNGYGPTENTTFSTWYVIRGVTSRSVNIPIGHPIANSTCYVMDKYLHVVPVGIIGELYLGGDGLAWGYHERPGFTAEKFIPHPFSETPGERLYRTGDLVHRLSTGNICFNGRIDTQVKIRGFRIELSEIEKVLDEHEEVLVSVTKVWTMPDKRIVAYLVTGEKRPDLDLLRTYLKTQLPEYMVPAAFVFLDQIPVTPNGKVDHRALPAPEIVDSSAQPKEKPVSETQKSLAVIWQELFKIQDPNLDDNFFDLGGHSLLVTQMATRIRERFGSNLTLRSLFDNPTIKGIAKLLEREPTPAATKPVLADAQPKMGRSARRGVRIALDEHGQVSQEPEQAHPLTRSNE